MGFDSIRFLNCEQYYVIVFNGNKLSWQEIGKLVSEAEIVKKNFLLVIYERAFSCRFPIIEQFFDKSLDSIKKKKKWIALLFRENAVKKKKKPSPKINCSVRLPTLRCFI